MILQFCRYHPSNFRYILISRVFIAPLLLREMISYDTVFESMSVCRVTEEIRILKDKINQRNSEPCKHDLRGAEIEKRFMQYTVSAAPFKGALYR